MPENVIADEQWSRIYCFCQSCRHVHIYGEQELRRFFEAVLWITRSGAQWRLLPREYGKWNSIYKRYARWCDQGVWDEMHRHFTQEPDMEYLMIDSTSVCAHPCAAGAPQKKGGNLNRGWDAVVVASAPRSTSVSTLSAIRSTSS